MVAEGAGFEPAVVKTTPVFKTGALSQTLPPFPRRNSSAALLAAPAAGMMAARIPAARTLLYGPFAATLGAWLAPHAPF